MKGDDQKCFAAGCDEYLTKPIDRKKLIETLKKYLSKGNKTVENKQTLPQNVQHQTENKQENVPQNNAAAAPTESTELELDWQMMMERVGDEQLVDEIMPVFLKDNTERMGILADSVKRNDSKEVKFYAHSIKGAAGIIGASQIFELAKQLEFATYPHVLSLDADEVLPDELKTSIFEMYF